MIWEQVFSSDYSIWFKWTKIRELEIQNSTSYFFNKKKDHYLERKGEKKKNVINTVTKQHVSTDEWIVNILLKSLGWGNRKKKNVAVKG